MIITDPKRVRRLRAARRSPYLPMLTFDIQALCKKIAKAHFPDLRLPVFVSFVEDETLAYVVKETDRADIFIHVLMNDPSTPRQVFHHVLTHELLHLIVPYETINGKEVSHTPTFWLHESRLVPERSVSWTWIWRSFGRCLRGNLCRNPDDKQRIDALKLLLELEIEPAKLKQFLHNPGSSH
jgi:hypothetical protein